MGFIHIYCGDGKGKTTAAIGLAVRASGCGCPVVVARFLKGEDSGEVSALRSLAGITVLPCRRNFGFSWKMTEEVRREARECYGELLRDGFSLACRGGFGLLILDEVFAAVNSGLLEEKEVLKLLDGRPEYLEVVLTGRNPPEAFLKRADYITEMRKLRHPFDSGIAARRGIEY